MFFFKKKITFFFFEKIVVVSLIFICNLLFGLCKRIGSLLEDYPPYYPHALMVRFSSYLIF